MSITDTAINAAVAGGTSAMLFAAFGIEPQALIWALVGSVLGVTFAPASGRLYAIAMFVAATMTCALIATWASIRYLDGDPLSRNLVAVLSAAIFHPALKKTIDKIGDFIGAFIDRMSAAIGGPK